MTTAHAVHGENLFGLAKSGDDPLTWMSTAIRDWWMHLAASQTDEPLALWPNPSGRRGEANEPAKEAGLSQPHHAGPSQGADGLSPQTGSEAVFLPVLRKLSPADQDQIEALFLRLDAPDRWMRFCGAVSTQMVASYSRNIDWSDTIILGCFSEGELRGIAELKILKNEPGTAAELAITVDHAFQDKGVGTLLVRRMLTIARNRFVGKIYMICAQENKKMQHVAGKMAAELVYRDGEVEASIWPSVPTYLSVIEEMSMEGQALYQAMIDPGKEAA